MRIDLTLKPIGYIKTPFKQKFGTPRQSGLVPSARGELILDNERVPPGSLDGLEDFSHLWLLFHFHENTNETVSGKVKPPRLGGEKMGLFATRSPHRPNPVGLSVVKIEKVDQKNLKLELSGVDLIDDTPIFDIKPYIASYDSLSSAHGGWTSSAEDLAFNVHWSYQALDQLKELPQFKTLQVLVEECLGYDLRNYADRLKGFEEKKHKVFLQNVDVTFTVDEKARVVRIEELKPV